MDGGWNTERMVIKILVRNRGENTRSDARLLPAEARGARKPPPPPPSRTGLQR